MRDIGKNIKQLRLQQKMTQDELAERLFVTRQTVSNYETGKSKPDVDMLIKISEVFNTDVHQLIYGPEPAPDKSKKKSLTIGVMLTFSLGLLYLIIQPVALRWRSNYIVSLGMMNRAFILPLMLLCFGWTLAQLAGTALRLNPFCNNWTNLGRRILLVLLCITLVLGIWYFAALVSNDWLYHHKISSEWVDIEVTNTADNTTYTSQVWQSLPAPVPSWVAWFGLHVLVMGSGTRVWIYPLLGIALWLLGFPKKKI